MNANDGRKIKAVFWPDSGGEAGRCFYSGKNGAGQLVLRSTYHGDRDEIWIVEEVDGKEVSRHNPRYVESIQWAE